jgi:hypothetical protein
MAKETKMSFKDIQNLWNCQPFLERLLFLIKELKVSQDEAEKLANLEFKKLADSYKVKIFMKY